MSSGDKFIDLDKFILWFLGWARALSVSRLHRVVLDKLVLRWSPQKTGSGLYSGHKSIKTHWHVCKDQLDNLKIINFRFPSRGFKIFLIYSMNKMVVKNEQFHIPTSVKHIHIHTHTFTTLFSKILVNPLSDKPSWNPGHPVADHPGHPYPVRISAFRPHNGLCSPKFR